MMATAAVIGLSAGKRLLSSSFYYSDLNEKLNCTSGHSLPCHQVPSVKNVITAKKSSDYSPSCVSSRKSQSAKSLKEHVDITADPSDVPSWFEMYEQLQNESDDEDDSVEVLLLLQKSMLEKQWNLSLEQTLIASPQHEKKSKKTHITCSGTSARRRRMDSRQRVLDRNISATPTIAAKPLRSIIGPELLQNRLKGYVKGVVSEELLTHAEVLQLSKKIQVGLYLEEQKSR